MIYTWYETLKPEDLPEGVITELELPAKKIALLRKGEALYAFAPTCPHSGAPLCQGWLDTMGRIVCPLHKYRFDPANGRNTSGEGYKLKTYPLELRDGLIYVAL